MFALLSKRRICSGIPRFFSSSTTQNLDPKIPDFVAADYLVTSFGFSPDKAATVSKSIGHLRSPEKPDSVRSFLKEQGFSQADIKRLITWRPELLCSSPEKTLDPNLCTLRHMGLSTSALNQVILYNPSALQRHYAAPRLTFWMDFLGGDETALVKAFTRPKISLLHSQGFSTEDIRRIVCTVSRFITSRISGMEDLLERTKELGFQPGSGMFLQGLIAMTSVTRAALRKKMDLLKSFGWSEDDFFSAVRSAPLMVALNEEKLRAKMDFLLGEAKCAPSYIVSRPILLNCSLEKRLRPRNNVLHLLETRGLSVKVRGFLSAIQLTNNQFAERYIIPHKEEISGLHETYLIDSA